MHITKNYHTHTWRCNHAIGTEEEFVKAACERGFTTLGFSDHAPYPLPEEWHSFYRMRPDQVGGYVETLLMLREKYADRIDIKIGFEAEYYPEYFESFLSVIRPYPIDYLILGQHFITDESSGDNGSGRQTDDVSRLDRYIDACLFAINSGLYSYIAHPDIINFTGDEGVYRDRVLKLCEAAKAADIPLEFNLLGFSDKRHYPSERFLKLVAESGAKVIIGCDAHVVDGIAKAPIDEALAFCERLGVNVTQDLKLRRPL